MHTTLAELADLGDGIVTTSDAAEWGVSGTAIASAVRRGELIRVAAGAFVTPAPDGTPQERHRRRAQAVLRVLPARTVLTHHSALVWWGLPTHRAHLDVVHVGRVAKPSVKAAGGRVWHRLPADTPMDAETPELATSVSPATAVVQAGLVSGASAALVAADAALRVGESNTDNGNDNDTVSRGGVTSARLDAAARLYRACPSIGAVRRALEWADPRSESPGESLLRYDLLRLGYGVDLQFAVPAPHGRTYRADMRIDDTRVLVEYDGRDKYELGQVWEREQARRQERERERDLRRAGWRIARFTRSDLGRADVIHRRIAEAA